ncbi:MAG: Hsp20/alpha crystallin family protein [Nitrosopumilus sp.]|nr:Hsp20/alpha crystallin family protein [Nitrosopumilus sp.]MDH3517018.1 Hsp20/alpha crystallin family protein [Nitrosopumilus sp.]MDH3565623.1 Hsp20/alpha crystallin family protein [Nitrosopumilus sp.]MDH5416575.1 Hsp20/alpha crystallin family protein [Nitrosopumilus sp.]MDH5555175.1 Hsp20/alpha crystallin family protein [Nitrosopumilus sp.]
MTMFFDDEFDRIFKRMSNSFMNLDDLLDDARNTGSISGPYYYGYTMTIGPDGKPIVKEYGNVKPGLLPGSDTRDPVVDTVVDEKEKTVKLIAEMPGVEKSNINVTIEENIVKIKAEQDKKKYHSQVPLQIKVDENSVKASYKNGILEVTLKILEEEKPRGKKVEVE